MFGSAGRLDRPVTTPLYSAVPAWHPSGGTDRFARSHGQFHFHFEPGLGVARADAAFVELDRAARNREAEADAPAGAGAIGAHAIEGIEDPWQRLLRHTRAAVAHVHHYITVVARQGHFHRRLRRRIADRIANHVLHGAPQQLRIAFHGGRLGWFV